MRVKSLLIYPNNPKIINGGDKRKNRHRKLLGAKKGHIYQTKALGRRKKPEIPPYKKNPRAPLQLYIFQVIPRKRNLLSNRQIHERARSSRQFILKPTKTAAKLPALNNISILRPSKAFPLTPKPSAAVLIPVIP